MNTNRIKTISLVCLCASFIVYNYCLIHGKNVDDPSNFGYVGQAQLGTANVSTASGINQQMANGIHRTPVEGPIASVQIALNYEAFLMESEEEIRNG